MSKIRHFQRACFVQQSKRSWVENTLNTRSTYWTILWAFNCFRRRRLLHICLWGREWISASKIFSLRWYKKWKTTNPHIWEAGTTLLYKLTIIKLLSINFLLIHNRAVYTVVFLFLGKACRGINRWPWAERSSTWTPRRWESITSSSVFM